MSDQLLVAIIGLVGTGIGALVALITNWEKIAALWVKLVALIKPPTGDDDAQEGDANPPVTSPSNASFPLVESREQIDENLRRLQTYLKSSRDEERAFAKDLLRRAKCLVLSFRGGQVLAGPSRFVGYASNGLEKHKQNVYMHGSLTNAAISSVFGQDMIEDSAQEQAYQDFCRQYQVERVSQSRRKYWRVD